ncbi:MBL fold metallo-hydrolase [Pollutimonas thiosulfatoxidans]|uniref:MBL fold metallo-hydrolase n=1 Tax=Pollutimonas thiosulfatoxidans TaxID=2028345 RepID=A0A410GAS9_9BURK|nr:MBL fold metallo-hydrolase [Pollutimonas thiosulfatoxidans]QAA93401.1 MBL fold metallo-hydrolase [Pollutimonas thiosulfatoxidans]
MAPSFRGFRRYKHLLLLAALACCSGVAVAQVPPQPGTQVPGYYRMVLGEFEATALYDGFVDLDPGLLKGATEKDIQTLIARMFVPTHAGGVQTAVNGFLVNTGDNLILVDAGAAACFGPTLGNIPANLQASGYETAQVDTVLLTHLHGDHACGITNADGTAVFPNATVYVAKEEAAFWLNADIAAKAPEALQPFFKAAQQAVAPYVAAGKLKKFNPGDPLLPGVDSHPLPGHTPGHGGYLFSTPKGKLLVWGDVIHSHSVQFARPEVAIEFDVDPQQAIATRRDVLALVSKEALWIAGAHLPFPGLGHVRHDDTGYAWVPVEFSPTVRKVR